MPSITVRTFTVLIAVIACAGRAPAAPAPARTMDQYVHERTAALLARAEKDESLDAARAEADALLMAVAGRAPDGAVAAFRDAAYAVRLLGQLDEIEPARRKNLAKFLRANEEFARSLAFLVRGDESPKAVYAVLDELRAARGPTLNRYPELTAALCVVHDTPMSARAGREKRAATAVELFDYFVAAEGRLAFGLRGVPPELLAFVVDTPASVQELQWALGRYAGDRAVGARFHEIRYDETAFRTGGTKRVEAAGEVTLPNILRHGGVCAEQAYFAANVGKAIGVPSTYAWGQGGNVSHAWVGFLQAAGRKSAAWNFDSGRYEEYRGVRGNVIDPQSQRDVPDSYASLLAESIGIDAGRRHAAVALTDAARCVAPTGKTDGRPPAPVPPTALRPTGPPSNEPPPPIAAAPTSNVAAADIPADVTDALPSPRPRGVATALALLKLAVEQNPAERGAWDAVRQLAADGALDAAQKREWSDSLMRLCGRKYPDFVWDALQPMIAGVEAAAEQDRMWQAVLKLFPDRKDLAAAVRIAQGRMWADRGDVRRAGECFQDVVARYADAGPFAVDALRRIEELVSNDTGRLPAVIRLYDQTWRRITQPERTGEQFFRQSNWFKVGQRLAELLEESGDASRARTVRHRLGIEDTAIPPTGNRPSQRPPRTSTGRERS